MDERWDQQTDRCFQLVEGLVGLRSESGLVFSHVDGVLGWLRGWLVSGLSWGWFLTMVLVL